jgi:glycosyltransferase involved in cell wall biosynthesis
MVEITQGDKMNPRSRILFIGNFLSAHIGTKGVSELLSEKFDANGWETLTVSSAKNRILRIKEMIEVTFFRRADYDLAHVDIYSGFAFIWAEIVCQVLDFLKKPYVLILRGGGLPSFAKKWPWRIQRLLSRANKVVTPSHYLLQNLNQYRQGIIYLPNGLDLHLYSFQLRENPSPKLVWLRAFHKIYNPCMAIETAAILQKTFPTMRLTMIGPDKGDGTFEQAHKLMREKNLEKYIEFIGEIQKKDVPVWLHKSDVFINTTNLESFGVAVMEAGAMGLPIVTTNVGELPYLWTNEEDALLVPADDAAAMAKAVERILTEPGLAKKLSQNARQKALNFDWDAILEEWERLAAQVLETH